jgi:hypothetical protein
VPLRLRSPQTLHRKPFCRQHNKTLDNALYLCAMKPYTLKTNHKIILTINDIARVWYRFRSIDPGEHAALHAEYCEMIQEAIKIEDGNEALRLLGEAIAWYNNSI